MSNFKKFYDKKIDELNSSSLTFHSQAVMGTHPLTTRQPANFHFYLSVLERMVPDVNRSEVLFEAIQSAYLEVVSANEVTGHAQIRLDSVRSMLLNAWCSKCSKLDSDMTEGETGFCSSEATKAIANDFITDWMSGNFNFDELMIKYKETYLGECIHADVLETLNEHA